MPDSRSAPFFVVFNHASGRGVCDEVGPAVEAACAAAGRRGELLPVEQPKRLAETAREAVRRAREAGGIVVAAGGDGTINGVAQAVLGSGCRFGVLPRGTVNYFARTHGIPSELDGALRVLLNEDAVAVKVGQLNERVFLVNASLGLYPQLLEDREAWKHQFGRNRLVALGAGIKTILRGHRSLRLNVEMAGQSRQVRTPTLFVGNNALQMEHVGLPEARAIDEGCLAGVMLKPIGRWSLLALLARAAFGQLGKADQVQNFSFRRLIVNARAFGSRRIRVATDGESAVDAATSAVRGGAASADADPAARAGAGAARGPGRQQHPGWHMTVALQVSDPHFGTERPKALAALERLCADLHPDLLLVTGDITQRARPVEFSKARAFFDKLDVPSRLIVPGNHDIPLFDIFTRAFHPYSRYIRAFGPALEGEFERDDLLVVALNTTRRYRHKHGEVSQAQIDRVAERLAAAAPGQVRLVVVYQPVAVTKEVDVDNLLRGHENAVRRWAHAGADAVIGGHIHLPYVLPLKERRPDLPHPTWAVQAGTALSTRVRDGISNSVNVIRTGPGRSAVVDRWDVDETAGVFRQVKSTVIAG